MTRYMRSIACAAALAVTVLSSTFPARADVIWVLNNIPLDDGGTLNGTFSINVYGYLGDWNLTTSSGSTLSGFGYTPVINSNINNPTDTVVDFYTPNYVDVLQLTFANSLTVPGINPIIGGIGGPSYECVLWSCPLFGGDAGPLRFITSSELERPFAISAVPELATWVLMLLGFAGLGFIGYHRSNHRSRLISV